MIISSLVVKKVRGTVPLVVMTVTAIACVAAFGGCGDVAFTVDGRNMGRAKFEREVGRRISIIEKNNPEEMEGRRGKELKKETERQVATELIRAALMEKQAAEMGISAPGDEVGRRLEEERARQGYEQFQKELKAQGLTEVEYRERLEEQILVEELGKKVCEGITVTTDEAESYYLTHKDLFSSSVMVHLAHILMDTEGQARIVAGELERGKDFTSLAKAVSKDYTTKNNGGDLGWIENGTMDPALEQAAFGLASGEVSGVVEASDGYHVLRVLERREAYTPPFEEVKNEAEKVLLNQKKEEAFSDWLRTVYANATVKINGGLGKWDPRLGMVIG